MSTVPDLTSLSHIPGHEWSDEYMLAQCHFHWGSSSAHGSEHHVDGHEYALEMHCVHYKEEYGSVANAMTQSDGLVVIGAFFQEGAHHDELQKILEPTKAKLAMKSSHVSDCYQETANFISDYFELIICFSLHISMT